MQRKDITDKQVCIAYYEYQKDKPFKIFALDILIAMTSAPEKVAYAAMERAYERGLIECGVSLRSGWLTDKGKHLLK